MAPRVVLIPGLMGSALRDATRPLSEIQALCARHWEIYPRLKRSLEERGNELCNKDSDAVWGKIQFLHWLADVKAWLELLTSGDGYKTPGGLLPKGFTELSLRVNKNKTVEFKPYHALVTRLEKAGVDLLELPYDWRLRVHHAADRLNQAILEKWFDGRPPDGPLRDSERVILIGHSLGGIVARLLVEDPRYIGNRVVRRAVLIATPNKGAPVAWAYLMGAKKFFDDYPVWKVLRDLHEQHPRDTKPSPTSETVSTGGASAPAVPNADYVAWSSREIKPAIILEEEQTDLVRSLASIYQLLPTYDFVELDRRGTKEGWEDTYKGHTHPKTGNKVGDIHAEASSVLKDPVSLHAWLEEHEIYYDFIGSTALRTVTALRPIKSVNKRYDLVRPKGSGDGTVPTFSSLDWAREAKRKLSRFDFVEADPRSSLAVHAKLCQHKQVVEHCVAVATRLPKSLITSADDPHRMDRGNIYQYMRIAHDLFIRDRTDPERPMLFVPRTRRDVISFALIEGSGAGSLIDPDTKVENKKRVLKEAVPGLEPPRVVYCGRTDGVGYRFVLLKPKYSPYPGVLFVPERSENWLILFGIITANWEEGPKRDNGGHAEMPLKDFLEAQDRSWLSRIVRVHVWNENLALAPRRGRVSVTDKIENLGFSPCAPCCADLANIRWPATDDPKGKPHKIMHWNTLYPGNKKAAYENKTTSYSLGLMKDAGWEFPLTNPMPHDWPSSHLPQPKLNKPRRVVPA